MVQRIANNGREVAIRAVINDSGRVYEMVFTEKFVAGVGKRKRAHTVVMLKLQRQAIDDEFTLEITRKWIDTAVLPELTA